MDCTITTEIVYTEKFYQWLEKIGLKDNISAVIITVKTGTKSIE